jgi:hypothetical protein
MRMNVPNVSSLSLEEIKKLGLSYLYNSNRDKTNRILYIKVGLLLLEWANNNSVVFDIPELHLFAKTQRDFWLISGISSDQFNIRRSQDLYENLIKRMGVYPEAPNVWLEYSKVLQFNSEHEKASNALESCLESFESDASYPSYLFHLGL